MKEIDFDSFTEEQRDLFAHYSIVPGPLFDDFGREFGETYVTSFIYLEREDLSEHYYDIYYTLDSYGKCSVIYRSNPRWEGDYGSLPLSILITRIDSFHRAMLKAMKGVGTIEYSLNKGEPND
jgi:hypothetical protein